MASSSRANDIILDVEKSLEKETTLEFQDFAKPSQSSSSGRGGVSAAAAPPPPPPPVDVDPIVAAASKKPMWTVDYYKQYFNVDTNEVVRRMAASVLPRKRLLDLVHDNPDLYGPFWIASTVIFLLFVTNSIAKSIDAYIKGVKFEYDFAKLTAAASVLYIFISIVPLLLWGIIRYMKFPVKLVELVTLYGYGLTVWMPMTILTLVPSESVHWIVGIVGTAISGVYIVRNSTPIFSSIPGQEPTFSVRAKQFTSGTIVLLLSVAVQIALGALFIFWLFHVTVAPVPAATTPTIAAPTLTTATVAATTTSAL